MSDALGFLPDTKPDVAEPWRKVLLDAADYIDKHGLHQGGFGNRGEARCTWGAIICATHDDTDLICLTMDRFEPTVGGDAVRWNDAPGRTAAEVTAALRACARQ